MANIPSILNPQSVHNAMAQLRHPLLNTSFTDLGAISSVTLNGPTVRVDLQLGVHAASLQHSTVLAVQAHLEQAGFINPEVHLSTEVLACPERNSAEQLARVKNVVMVASGKGGVGKSTTAVNLALALSAEGAKVGLLDADIYGPSQRTMLGVPDEVQPTLVDGKYLQPIKKLGLSSMSVAYMSAAKTPMVWRGPMAVRALMQLLEQTLWGELDYLIIDMPPGTGDIQISLSQKLNVSGAVVVTTPQEIALMDARKGVEMFQKTGIPVLGIVENMATHICSNCGHEEAIFGAQGAHQMAEDYQVPLLGSLPLDARIRQNVDIGMPTVVKDPAGPLAQAYLALARQVAAHLWQHNLTRQPLPEIQVVEN